MRSPDPPGDGQNVGQNDGQNDGHNDGHLSQLIDEQLELAAARLPALEPAAVHPSPIDHDERTTAHPDFEDLLLGNAQPSAEALEELAALQSAPALSDDELARQALEGVADADAAPDAAATQA